MEWPLLILITFFAATVQAAMGFGFGLIAVSAFLIMLNSVAAIQIVIIITLVMSCVHWPKLRGLAPTDLLKWLSLGCLFGFPLGVLVYTQLNLDAIKMAVAILIILISLQNAWYLFRTSKNNKLPAESSRRPDIMIGVGIASGLMATAMAMPGPAVMLYLSRTTLSKNEIRATILTFFIFSYAGALIVQTTMIGISAQTWLTSALLFLPAFIGVFVGDYLSNRINQKSFKGLVLVILLMTGLFMLFNL